MGRAMNRKTDFDAMWHTLAVGLYYREQAAQDPKVYYHWEQQTLAVKLHYQAKAKRQLREMVEGAL
jgi:hypothetical protein